MAEKFKIISQQITQAELAVMLRELKGVVAKKVGGDVVEFGCCVGTTSLYLRRGLVAGAPKH